MLVDDASVFRDGRFQLALLEQLLGTSQDSGTIYGHGDEASTELVDGIKQRRWPKRTPVRVRVAEPCDSLEMIGRCVPLMAVETVSWILCMKLLHETIARNLGHDGGRSNGRTPSIAMGHAALRHGYVGHAKRVDEHDIRQRSEQKNRALHRSQRRLMNVDAIDFGRIGGIAPGTNGRLVQLSMRLEF